MRICIVMEYHPDDLIGGAETQVFGLAREFARLGHDVSYVCQRYDRGKPSEETVDGVRVLRALRWHKAFRFLVAWRLLLTIRRLRPEVTYQRFVSPLTGLTALAAHSLSIPFVWGCAEDATLEKGYLLQQRVSGIPVSLRWAKQTLLQCSARITQSLFYFGLRRAEVVVVQNALQLALLEKNFGRGGVLIPNGVAIPPSRGQTSQTPLVLWLNRIAPRKNAEMFIDLARSMQEQYPQAQFVLVGGRQEDAYMETIRNRAAGASNLELTGNVPPSEVWRWFERAWVFVLSSTGEGFPNVLLQAWAAGTPVVSLTVDPDGVIARESLGFVSGTVEGLARDIARLLDYADLRERLANTSRAYVAEHFEIGAVAEQYLSLFQALASR